MTDDYNWLRSFINEGIYVIGDSPKPGANKEKSNGEKAEAIPSPKFRGDNGRNILILLNEPLHEKSESLLTKILASAGLTWKDIALVVWPENPRADLIKTLDTHVVISFGLESDPWCDTVPYKITTANGLSHLQAGKLHDIANDLNQKRQLWSALKSLFGV